MLRVFLRQYCSVLYSNERTSWDRNCKVCKDREYVIAFLVLLWRFGRYSRVMKREIQEQAKKCRYLYQFKPRLCVTDLIDVNAIVYLPITKNKYNFRG